MSRALAAVMLAHDDPAKVRRLIGALDGVEVFLHCDRKAPDAVLQQMLNGAAARVQLVPRHRTNIFSWSLVEAELAGLRLALERTRAEHLIVLSGSCYPLVAVERLADELAAWRGRSRLQLDPLPYRGWDTPRNRDGGLWRLRRRFVSLRGRVLLVGGVPVRTLARRIPPELRPHASAHWKIYARAHAAALLRVLDERPDLERFWRTSFVPEESCAASILASPGLVGRVAEELRDDLPWYIDWGSGPRTLHPEWLGGRDFTALRAARESEGKLFARKVSSRERELLDRVDEELRT